MMAQEITGFDIVKQIGKGSIANVYLAVQKEIGRQVVIKIMWPQFSGDERFKADFLRETRIAARLNQRSIVPIHTVGEVDGCCYLIMEYMAGGNLRQQISHGMSEDQVVNTMVDLAAALDFAHSKAVIHGSVKPENILFREDGSVVIGDFGVSKVIHESFSESASSGVLDYYAPYMSLEQALARVPDERSDIYSLGLVFYEMLTGEILHQANTSVFSVIKNAYASLAGARLPQNLSHWQPVFEKMVAKDPDDRYQTAKALAEDLLSYKQRGGRVEAAPAIPDDDSTVRLDMKAVLAAAEVHSKSPKKPAVKVKPPLPQTSQPASTREQPKSARQAPVKQQPVEPKQTEKAKQTRSSQVKPSQTRRADPIMVPLGKVTPRSMTIPAMRAGAPSDNQLTSKAKIFLAGCVASVLVAVLYLGMRGSGDVPEQLVQVSADFEDIQQVENAADITPDSSEPVQAQLAETAAPPLEDEEIPDTVSADLQTAPEVASETVTQNDVELELASAAQQEELVDASPAEEMIVNSVVEDSVEPDSDMAVVELEPEQSTPSEIESMMSAAAEAMYNNHLLVPSENSAYELYMGVLEKEPGHPGAKAGLGQIVDRYLVIASQHLNDGELDQAEKYANRALLVAAQDKVAHEYELKAEDKLVVIRRVKNLDATEKLNHWLALLQNREQLTVSDLENAFTAYMTVLEMNLYEDQVAEAKDVYADAFYDLGTRYLNDEELETARELIAKGLQIKPKDEDLRALEARWVRWHDARAWITE